MADRLDKLGVKTVHDLIFYFPRTYLDYTQITKIGKIATPAYGETRNDNHTIKAKIINIANRRTSRRRFTVTEAVVADDTGSIKVVWFNQPFLEKMLKPGQEIVLNGKISFDPFSHQLQMESPNRASGPKIMPKYPETVGIRSGYISKLVSSIKNLVSSIEEYIPDQIIAKNSLFGLREAILQLHMPTNSGELAKARERMAFDELFLFSLQKQLSKQDVQVHKAPKMNIDEKFLKDFVSSLPFKLTDAQRKAAWQIIKDMTSDGQSVIARPEAAAICSNSKIASSLAPRNDNSVKPMNRLLNGDVGSGKTVVAAFAAAVVIKNGFRVVLMAPTEILANQHFQTLSKILEPHGISVGLVTSAENKLKAKSEKCKTITENLKDKKPEIIVGTHALLHLKEPVEDIGLVIIDEQHRFGVSQREKLLHPYQFTHSTSSGQANKSKNEITNKPIRPHFLSMTATPIPRTISLVVFADLDVSVIDEMPADRKKIITRIVEPNGRSDAYEFIRKEVKLGHQIFVICPLIEEKEQGVRSMEQVLFEEDRKTVTKESERLKKEVFPDLRIAMLHGKLPATPSKGGRGLAPGGKSKQEIMEAFKKGEYDILVSTSVVEVGVDIPGATVMMIENAECFGLAQLHQFRGRVGRSDRQSYCLLFSASNSENARKRLSYMESVSSGFELAEKDLELRGPGTMYGYQQSGFWDFRFADIGDRIMIERTTEAAKAISPEINKYPKLMEKAGEKAKHLE